VTLELLFDAHAPHWPTSSRRAPTKEPNIHKDRTDYPQTIHGGQERRRAPRAALFTSWWFESQW